MNNDRRQRRRSLGFLLGLLVRRMLPATRTKLGELKLVRRRPLVLVRVVVALPADGAFQCDESAISASHGFTSLPQKVRISSYSMILVMTPAPTVRPPSRMAKR